jgi:hypothetical protein
MDILVFVLAAVGITAIVTALQAWRDREHRYDVALLAMTGAGLGASAVVIAV